MTQTLEQAVEQYCQYANQESEPVTMEEYFQQEGWRNLLLGKKKTSKKIKERLEKPVPTLLQEHYVGTSTSSTRTRGNR